MSLQLWTKSSYLCTVLVTISEAVMTVQISNVASFPGRSRLQFLIAHCMQKRRCLKKNLEVLLVLPQKILDFRLSETASGAFSGTLY